MRGRRFLLLCFLLFAAGCLGRVALRPPAQEAVPFTLTVRADAVDALLLSSLPAVGEQVHLGTTHARITALSHEPVLLRDRENGKEWCYPSRLFLRVTFTLSLTAREQNALPVLGATPSFLGDEVTLSGEAFVIRGQILEISRHTVGENA